MKQIEKFKLEKYLRSAAVRNIKEIARRVGVVEGRKVSKEYTLIFERRGENGRGFSVHLDAKDLETFSDWVDRLRVLSRILYLVLLEKRFEFINFAAVCPHNIFLVGAPAVFEFKIPCDPPETIWHILEPIAERYAKRAAKLSLRFNLN